MSLQLLKKAFFLTLLILLPALVRANHIVGGELQLQRTGSANLYEVRLIQFWDSNNLTIPTATTGGNRDQNADVYLYRKRDNQLMDVVRVGYQSSKDIAYQNRACATIRALNTSIGIYRGTINLDPSTYSDPEGYYLVWERCCRNDDINNIATPGENGMVFYLEFPPTSILDSSPMFVIPNGQYICANRSFTMNMGATDADGDELRYSLVDPMRGVTTPRNPIGNYTSARPYSLVSWAPGISLTSVIPGPSPLRISNKGILSVTAGALGLYVFAIQVEEYRNGKLIGLVRRDFQLLVIDCNDDQPDQPIIMHNDQPAQEVLFCPKSSVELKTEESQDWSYQWQFNGLNIPGATSASIMVQDSGNYSVVKSYTKKCSRDTASQVVHAAFAPPLEAVISADKEMLCDGASMQLQVNGGNLLPDQTLSWQLNNAALNNKGATMEITAPGTYTVEITNSADGCSGRDTLTVAGEQLALSLPPRKGVLEGSSTTLNPSLRPDHGTNIFQWSPPDGLLSAASERNATVAPAADTTYTLTVTSVNGCVYEASTRVYLIAKMFIPAAFSPNRDGMNDTFEIFNTKGQIEEVRIYNRWGELIFMSAGYEKPWDGTYKQQPAPAGSYPYVIKTAEGDWNGTVLLLK